MEMTGKALREVEFRDRLRGYDTDEVDEFLEKVAVDLDETHAELQRLAERAQRAEQKAEELPALDDEGIKRTLVLAQRTADMAIKEAQGEADRVSEQAKSQAEQLVAEATNRAQKLRNEAESELQAMIAKLTSERGQLERQVRSLQTLVDSERTRLSDALTAMLSLVGENFALAPEVAAALPTNAEHEVESVDKDDPFGLGLPDIDKEISDDADSAYGGRRISSAPIGGLEAGEGLDPDEELWERWAKSAELDEEPASADDPFRFGRPDDSRPA